MLLYCLSYFSVLKTEAMYFSEMSVDFQRTTRRYNPEDRALQALFLFLPFILTLVVVSSSGGGNSSVSM
jgi:hypothetical protein